MLTVCGMLSGCDTDTPADSVLKESSAPFSDVSDVSEASGIQIAGEGAPEYVVLRGDNASKGETEAAVLVHILILLVLKSTNHHDIAEENCVLRESLTDRLKVRRAPMVDIV